MADLGGENINSSSSNSSNGVGGLGGGGRLALGAAKTRPLGQVKTETLHFQTTPASAAAGMSSAALVAAGSGGTLLGGGGGAAPVPRPSPFLPVPVPTPTTTPAATSAAYPELRRGASCEDQGILLRASIKSMREIRENLRQAALLNIVAAANSDGGASYHHQQHFHHQQCQQQHHHHHHSKQQQQQQQLSEGPPPPSAPELRLHFLDTSQLPPPHHHYRHHHQQQLQQLQQHQQQRKRKHQTSPLTLHMTTNGTSPFQQSPEVVGGGGGGRSAGSGTYHHSSLKKDGGDTSPLPHTLVANILSPRMRTISIPRPGPRIGDLSGPFIHKSLTQAKECLYRVGEMVRSRTEGALQLNDSGGGEVTAVTNEEGGVVPYMGHTAVSEKLEEPYPDQSPTVPALVQLLDSPVNGDASKSTSAAEPPPPPPSKAGSASSRDVSNTLPPPQSASSSSSNSRRTLADARSAGSRKTRGSISEDRSGGSSAPHHHHHRALSVRRHLSPGKKRELVKRLTEMAKCEAVDMSNPMGTQEEKNHHLHENRFRPPMIILSQQRQEIRCPAEEESSSSMAAVQFSGVSNDAGMRDLPPGGNSMHRAKSLTSLNHAHSYPAASSRETQHLEGPSTERVPGRLYRANSGSMPDLVMEGGAPSSAYNQRDMKRSDSSDWTAAASASSAGQTFAEGIVGKTLLKEKEVGNTRGLVAESPRPLLLLPSTPKYRSRRSTRPSSRRSTLGLRDRGPPLETPTGATTATTTTTTTSVLSLNPSSQNRLRSSHGGGVVPQASSDPPPASQQNLPVLTITGLNRERPPPGTPSANSRANRELRPTSRAEVAGSLQFYQQLDDQCEKLQRQLNITLNMPPRRVPHWQSGTIPPTSSIPMNRTGFSPYPHHASMFLTDGPEDTDVAAANTTSSHLYHHHHHDPNSNPVPPLSDVEEDSHGDTNATRTDTTTHPPHPHGEDANLYPDRTGHQNYYCSEGSASSLKNNRKAGSCSVPPQSEAADPVLQSKKEPRYQGFSSRVPESEVRSQFHYVTPGSVAGAGAESESGAAAVAATAEEEREMKYRVLKALDQDVYYDFQHRKYRNTPGSTPLVRCNNEEDRPRVHFYKVKLNGET